MMHSQAKPGLLRSMAFLQLADSVGSGKEEAEKAEDLPGRHSSSSASLGQSPLPSQKGFWVEATSPSSPPLLIIPP